MGKLLDWADRSQDIGKTNKQLFNVLVALSLLL